MPDATCDADGFHIYLRDLDDNFVWSAGYQPTRIAAAQYDFQCKGGIAEIVRVDRGIECRLSICVSPQLRFGNSPLPVDQVGEQGTTHRTDELSRVGAWQPRRRCQSPGILQAVCRDQLLRRSGTRFWPGAVRDMPMSRASGDFIPWFVVRPRRRGQRPISKPTGRGSSAAAERCAIRKRWMPTVV